MNPPRNEERGAINGVGSQVSELKRQEPVDRMVRKGYSRNARRHCDLERLTDIPMLR